MTQPPGASPARSRLFQRHWTWWFMVAVLVLAAVVRLRLLNFPLERDEGEYAYSGQLMLQGIPPYELAYNMKFPGTYAAYALIMAVFSQTPAGIHFGVLLMTTATALMLFWLGKKILDDTAGIVAATTYAILAASPSMLGLAGHATHFVAFFATAGMCLVWRARQNGSWLTAFMSGILFGLAVLMKQHAALIGAWAGIAFAVNCFYKKELLITKRLLSIAACAAGMILPFALCCLILWHAGVFHKFWFWTIDYARQYASVVPISYAPLFFWHGSRTALIHGFLVLPFAIAGMFMIWFDERLTKSRLWIFGFGLISALSVCPDFYFRKHYFLLMLPGAGLLAGCAVSGLCKFSEKKHPHARLRYWPIWIFALTLAVTIVTNANIWFLQTPTQAARTTYQADPFPEAEIIAAFIKKNSPVDTRLAILGSEPELYFLSHRHSATGYIYTYGLMEPQPFARQMQEEMIAQIESNSPEFIIFVDDRMSWWRYPDSDPRIFNWWDSYQTNYTVVAIADVLSTTNTVYAFGADIVKYYGEARGSALEVYQRKTSPPITSRTLKKF
jgi:hypothetical protein